MKWTVESLVSPKLSLREKSQILLSFCRVFLKGSPQACPLVLSLKIQIKNQKITAISKMFFVQVMRISHTMKNTDNATTEVVAVVRLEKPPVG